jgi:hypothetical protein
MSQTLTVVRTRTQPAEPATVSQLRVPTLENTLFVTAGTFGTLAGRRAIARCLRGGVRPLARSLDNSLVPSVPIAGPDGRPLEGIVLDGEHLYVYVEDRLAELRRHPLLVSRYLGSAAAHPGLLHGFTIANIYNRGGHGGSSIPQLSALDLDLRIAEVRRHLRGGLLQIARPGAQAGRSLDSLVRRDTQEQAALFALVLVGLSGSFGVAAALLLGYLLRQEAAALRLPRPTVWLLGAGPRAFTRLTGRTLLNFGAALEALQHLAQHGVDRPFISGPALGELAPPYDYTLLVDDPRLPAGGEKVSEGELDQFSHRVAAVAWALLQPAIREAYLSDAVNHSAEDGTAAWPGFGTIQLGLGGFDADLLTPLLQAELAYRRTAALAELLAAA